MRTLFGWMLSLCVGCTAAAQPVGGSALKQVDSEPGEHASPHVVAAGTTSGGFLGAGLERAEVLAGADAVTHLGVWLQVPDSAAPEGARPPMSVALVIDASGSMHGEKIQKAREAAHRFVQRLRDGDEVALYAFDDQVMEIMPPVALNGESRAALERAIAAVRDDGNTNMYGAVRAGQSAVARAPASHPIRRVVLLSDGRANVGPSSPTDFAQLAGEGAAHGTQVSAIGIGLDYHEGTLGALAVHSEGRMYHLEHAEQLASILEQELDLLGRTVATEAYVELEPADGVRIEGIENGRMQRHGDVVRIPVGSLFAGQEREFLLRAALPAGAVGERPFGRVRLTYVDVKGQARSERVSLRYGVTTDAAKAAASGHERVHAMVATQQAAEAQMVAARMLNDGDSQGAARVLEQSAQQLQVAEHKSSGAARKKLEKRRRKVQSVQRRAASSRSKREARGAALHAYDDAMEMQGY